MSLYEFLYVDSFGNAEDYTVHQLSLNKGSESCITKEKLTELAKANGIEVYKYPKKEELVKAVYSVLGKGILKYCRHTGAAAYSFMMKFRLFPVKLNGLLLRDFWKLRGIFGFAGTEKAST